MTTLSSMILRNAQEVFREHTMRVFDGGDGGTILISHFGEFSHAKVDLLLKFIESSVLLSGSKRKVMKRICSVTIECLQNITHHAARDESGSQQSFVLLSKHGDHFRLSTGNLILQEDSSLIDYRLSELNKLDQKEVRKLYIETLCNENFSFKGGAGLGFLTISKKTKSPIAYDLSSVNERFAYLSMSIAIPDTE